MTAPPHRGEPLVDRVRRALRREGVASASTIAAGIGESHTSVRAALGRLVDAGGAKRVGRLFELVADEGAR